MQAGQQRAQFSGSEAPRVGVVGAGGLGTHHVRILRDLCGERFVGFVDENPARAAEVASQYGVSAVASIDRLLQDVDAVSIVVPTRSHHAVAAQALALGKHVFVEKPFTVTLEEADDLLGKAPRRCRAPGGTCRAFQRAVRAPCRSWTDRGSSRATGWRRSVRVAPMWPWCSIS